METGAARTRIRGFSFIPRPRRPPDAPAAAMTVLLIASSPTIPSRSTALLEAAGERLSRRGARIERLAIRDLPAQALLGAEWTHPAIERAIDQVARARVVVVATPVYVWMSLVVHRQIRKDSGHRRSSARKWLTYMALFVAALVFLGDITYVIYSFLTGEATLRFLLKAAVVACVSGAVFWFYLRDIEEQADER